MNVLLDVPDQIIARLDAQVQENKLARAKAKVITPTQEVEMRRLLDTKGVEAANAYLRDISRPMPATSRRKLLLQIIEIGWRHVNELPGAAPAEARPLTVIEGGKKNKPARSRKARSAAQA